MIARGAASRTGLTRALTRLALPVVLGNVSQTLMGLVDTLMVGQLGAAPLAAVGVATLVFSAVASTLKSYDVAVQTHVAHRVGEGNDGEAGPVLATGLTLALVLGAVFTAVLLRWPSAPLALLSDDPDVRRLGVDYLRMRVPGMTAFMAYFILRSAFDGVGWTRVGMAVGIGMNAVNMLLNWALIFGRLGLPRLEVAGAGLASTLSTVLAVLALLAVALWPRVRRRFRLLRRDGLRRELVGPLTRTAWPAGVQALGALVAVLVFFAILGRISTVAVAAGNVVLRIAALSFMPAIGMGVAVQTAVGQALGARDPGLAVRTAWRGVGLSVVAMGLFGVVFLAAPRGLMGLFATDPRVVAAGVPILRLMGLVQILDAVGLTLAGALRGAGATRAVMLVDVITAWGVFLPAAWFFGVHRDGGLVGAWIGVLLWFSLYAVGMVWWFRRGAWRRKEV